MLFSIQDIELLEKRFSQNRYDGEVNQPNYFQYIEGKIPVLVSAPHATNHCKFNKLKLSEPYTGTLALLLNRWTNAHVIHLTKQDNRNPNGEETSEYKAKIKEVCEKHSIQLVLDLHGAAFHHPFDIDFGTSEGVSMSKEKLKSIWEVFYAHGLIDLTENEYFKAPYPTITHYTGTILNVPSVQLEINRKLRKPNEDFLSFHLLTEALIEIIRKHSNQK